MSRRSLVLEALVCWLLLTAAFGQVAITGKITGVVEDTSGAAIAGATVALEGPSLMAARSATTQANGS